MRPGRLASLSMEHTLEHPVVVDFPLRGDGWMAVTTPAHRVPSHGTDLLGQRYAYDLLRVDQRSGVHFHPASTLRGELFGGPTRESYAWGATIHAPFDAEVVRAVDGMSERQWIHPARELWHQLRNAATFSPEKLPSILGNHVILRHADAAPVFAALVHLAPGTVAVAEGQRVRTGDELGRVGHTGNSTSPHLHFQLMDSLDAMTARGIPCAFRAYEVERDGTWVPVANGIPGRRERIRSVQEA